MLARTGAMGVLIAALLLLVLGGASSGAADHRPSISSYHLVRSDPRLCPSPLCGGYWVALANRARTACHDGLRRSRCYVAKAVDEDGRPLASALPEGAIARAAIRSQTFDGIGNLGVVVVADVWSPLGRAQPGGYYQLQDEGVRCIRAPCFWVRASKLNSAVRTTISDLSLRLLSLTQAQRRRALSALATPDGLLALGRIVATADSGRLFRASRLFLRVGTPRA